MLVRVAASTFNDLDRRFDQLDVIQLVPTGEYLTGESANWNEGDRNGDSAFDQKDLIASLQLANYVTMDEELDGQIFAAIASATTDSTQELWIAPDRTNADRALAETGRSYAAISSRRGLSCS